MKNYTIILCLYLFCTLRLSNCSIYSSNFPWKQVTEEFHPTNIAQTLDHTTSSYADSKFARSILKEHSKYVPVYISLAACSFRFNTVQKVIKSILQGTILPDQIYIMISKEAYLLDEGISKRWLNANTELGRLIESTKLITVVYTSNIGPHRKLIPLLAQTIDMDALIVTIDDDASYSTNFLEQLLQAYKKSGENENEKKKD